MPSVDKHRQIAKSWDDNAERWTRAVREKLIPSRRTVTDGAVVKIITDRHPRRILDVGCGEGWLSRQLADTIGCEVVGIDGSGGLVTQARTAHENGTYLQHSYDEIASGAALSEEKYDVIVCNFSLLGEHLLELLSVLRSRLRSDGALVVQTTHPFMAVADGTYANGWRLEGFDMFEDEGWNPMPWYFRTFESWIELFRQSGLAVLLCKEPVDPQKRTPLSLIFVCVPA